MRILAVALVSSLALGASNLHADDLATTTPRRQYQMVLDEYEAAKRAFTSKFDTATAEEQRRLFPAQFPRREERALVQQLTGRPFALLSVNTDHDPEILRRAISEGEITWRCWWESGVEGPICSRWMIEGFPQVYLLDHKGVIRAYEFPDDAASNRAIEELLQACETERRTSK